MEESMPETNIEKEVETSKEGDKKKIFALSRVHLTRKTAKKAAYLLIALMCWVALLQYATAQKYEAVAKVAGENGEASANMNADKLDYGVVAKGESSLRFITIENRGTHAAYVKVLKSGDIADIMTIDATDFTLEAGETKELELTISVPEGADRDGYEGVIRIMKIPKLF